MKQEEKGRFRLSDEEKPRSPFFEEKGHNTSRWKVFEGAGGGQKEGLLRRTFKEKMWKSDWRAFFWFSPTLTLILFVLARVFCNNFAFSSSYEAVLLRFSLFVCLLAGNLLCCDDVTGVSVMAMMMMTGVRDWIAIADQGFSKFVVRVRTYRYDLKQFKAQRLHWHIVDFRLS
jgi:hypothetical protein